MEETSLDVYAGNEISILSGRFLIRLCIEAKKNDPRYSDWCFFQLHEKKDFMRITKITTSNTGHTTLMKVGGTNRTQDEIFVQTDCLSLIHNTKYDISDFAIALKSEKLDQEYYKSEKSVIDKSLIQIIKGTYGTILEHVSHQVVSGSGYSHNPDIFIPIIVTNANLFLCKFNVDDIDPKTAQTKIDPEYQPMDAIVCEYSKPKGVQFPDPISANLDPYRRIEVLKWHVLILSPKGFVDFLDEIDHLPKPAVL